MAGNYSSVLANNRVLRCTPAAFTSMLLVTPLTLLLVAGSAAASVLHSVQVSVLSDAADDVADRSPGASRASRHNAHVVAFKHPLLQLIMPDTLRRDVEAGFLRRYPTNAKLLPVQRNFSAAVTGTRNSGHGAYMGMQVRNVKVKSCTPVLSPMQIVGKRAGCLAFGCVENIVAVLRQRYPAVGHLAVMATLPPAAGGDRDGAVTIEWAAPAGGADSLLVRWDSWQSPSNKYTVFMNNGGIRCSPGMVHADLDCKVEISHYEWHSWWIDAGYSGGRQLYLEGNYHRKGGPYTHEQWCEEAWVGADALSVAPYKDNWLPLLAHDVHRGYAYQRPASELNKLPVSGHPPPDFADDDLVIRRHLTDEGPAQLVFRCKRYAPEVVEATVRVPLRSHDGTLPGKIGCVLGYFDPPKEPGVDAAEL